MTSLRGLLVLAVAVALLSGCAALPARSTDSDEAPVLEQLLDGPAARYLAIAAPANSVLDEAFDGLEDEQEERDDLDAARADLRVIAATERAFDRDLLAIALPARERATAHTLVDVNEARATLTEQAVGATSFEQLDRFVADIDLLNEVVEQKVALIRAQLGLPPPDAD